MSRCYAYIKYMVLMIENAQSITSLWQIIKRYLSLNIENAKLTATEKLTLLFAAAAFYFVAIIIGAIVLLFVTMSVSDYLSQFLKPYYVYLIIAAFYLLVFVAVYLMKNVLFLNPIARFVSKIMLNPPVNDLSNDETK